jgi:hypothetical protein
MYIGRNFLNVFKGDGKIHTPLGFDNTKEFHDSFILLYASNFHTTRND